MTLSCPECGTPSPRGAAPGKAYACPGCGNPVLARDVPPPPRPAAIPPPPVAPEAPPTPPPEPSTKEKWRTVLLVLGVLFAAYLGAFLLLTAEARRDRAALLDAWPELVTATDPGKPSGEGGRSLAQWSAKDRVWRKKRDYDRYSDQVNTMLVAFAVAFAAQVAFTAWLWSRARKRPASRAGTRARRP